jgi:hypothetical protein
VVLAATTAVATLFVVFATAGAAPGPGSEAAGAEPAAPGWRWESYDGVMAQVPDDWGHGRTGVSPCLAGKLDQPTRGYVGYGSRPGPIPAIACTGSSRPTPVEQSPYLWFDSQADAGGQPHGGGWVAESRVVGGLTLTVYSDDAALRTRILDSARTAPGGAHDGCPADHAVTSGPGARPERGDGLAAMGPAESITLCRYTLGDDEQRGRMLTSSRLSDEDSRAVVRAILAAPPGDGPNEPGSCLPETAQGDEVLLLVVRDGTHTQEVFVRYSGCAGHGTDDGRTHCRLTTEVLTPLLSGPHRPDVLNGAVAGLLGH